MCPMTSNRYALFIYVTKKERLSWRAEDNIFDPRSSQLFEYLPNQKLNGYLCQGETNGAGEKK